MGDGPDRVEHHVVAEELERARPTWNAEHVEGGAFREAHVGPQLQTPLRPGWPRVLPDEMHRGARHPGEDLVRSSEVELSDVGEEEEPDPVIDGHVSPRLSWRLGLRARTCNCDTGDTWQHLAERTKTAHILPNPCDRKTS